MVSTWLEWSVWIKVNFLGKPRMWEQVDYISCTKNNNPYIVQFHLCYLNSTNSFFKR